MWKKTLCLIAAIVTAALCLPMSFAEERTLCRGDTVEYIFTVGECENAAGISVNSLYSTKYLEPKGEPEFIGIPKGMVNTNSPGSIKWNTMITGGMAFSDTDIVIETFTVKRKCTLSDLKLSFECMEIFSHDLQVLPETLVTARVNIIETGTDDDSESDEPSQTSSKQNDTSSTSSEKLTDNDESDPGSNAPVSRPDTSSVRSIPTVSVFTTDLTPSEDEDSEESQAPKTTVTPRVTRSSANSVKPYVRPSASMAVGWGSAGASGASAQTDTDTSSSVSQNASQTSSEAQSEIKSSDTSAEISTVSSDKQTVSETISSAQNEKTKRSPLPALIAGVAAAAVVALALSQILKTKEE